MQYAKKPVILISLVLLGPTHTLNLLKLQPPKSSLASLSPSVSLQTIVSKESIFLGSNSSFQFFHEKSIYKAAKSFWSHQKGRYALPSSQAHPPSCSPLRQFVEVPSRGSLLFLTQIHRLLSPLRSWIHLGSFEIYFSAPKFFLPENVLDSLT